jgi:hypothetical protein
MLSRSRALQAATLACVTAACSDSLSEDRLDVALESSEAILIRFDCAASCPDPTLMLTIDYPQASYNPADTLQLLQYRVDYDVTGSKLELPYYAESLSLVIKPGDQKALSLKAAGQAQRDKLRAKLGSSSGSARASLQIAGYDWDNQQVFIHTDFDVQFRQGSGAEQATDDKTSE